MGVAESGMALTSAGAVLASISQSVYEVFDYEPLSWTESVEITRRTERLKQRYGKRRALPKTWAEVPAEFLELLPAEIRRQCEEHVRLGDETAAIRLAYCRKLAHLYTCPECGRAGKKPLDCKQRTCLACAKKNYNALFKRFLQVDSLIPAAVRCLPGWTWHVLDFSFRHDGDMPKRWELRAMVGVIRRTVRRAVREARREWYDARRGCRLRLNEDGTPMMSPDGWPMASAPDGSARELVGWYPIFFAEHDAPDNAARKRGEKGAKKKVLARYELRFAYELIRVTEFGFDNVNAHFHGAYFGPRLDYWYDKETLKKSRRLVCGGGLVEAFKEETRQPCNTKDPSKGGLGVESYTVFFEQAREGFRSVLAHALKYTEKIPTSTPEGLAQLEHALKGTRRVTLLGMHYGVSLKVERNNPKCSACGAVMERVKDLGAVPVSEVADVPDVADEKPREDEPTREPGADEFLELEIAGP